MMSRSLLKTLAEDIRSAAREIYYAKTHLPIGHISQGNLDLALYHLGIRCPEDVGLSSGVLPKGFDTND